MSSFLGRIMDSCWEEPATQATASMPAQKQENPAAAHNPRFQVLSNGSLFWGGLAAAALGLSRIRSIYNPPVTRAEIRAQRIATAVYTAGGAAFAWGLVGQVEDDCELIRKGKLKHEGYGLFGTYTDLSKKV